MRNKLFVIGILLCSNITHAQQRIAGLNKDIHVTKVGVKPYEMKNTFFEKGHPFFYGLQQVVCSDGKL